MITASLSALDVVVKVVVEFIAFIHVAEVYSFVQDFPIASLLHDVVNGHGEKEEEEEARGEA